MLAAFDTHYDRTGSYFQQQDLSTAPVQVNVATRPVPPAARHRRGLSLDQGMARNRQKVPNLRLDHFEPLQWQNIAPGLVEDALSYRSNTPFETDSGKSYLKESSLYVNPLT